MALIDGLKAYWKLNGNANDELGNSNGTASNVSWVAGKIGQAGSFNGSNSEISLPKNGNTYLSSNWTISAWVKKHNTSYGVETEIVYMMGNSWLFLTHITYYNGSRDEKLDNLLFNNLDTTNWHHYVWTKSSVNGNRYYQDGALSNSDARTTNNTSNYNYVKIGRTTAPKNNKSADLTISEVGIWDRALSAGEVSELYNGGAGITYPFSKSNQHLLRRRLLLR